MSQTIKNIRLIVASCAGIKPEKVRDDSHLHTDIGLDSLDVLELVMAMEDEYGIVIEDEEAVRCKTVEQISALVDGLLAKRTEQITFFPAGSLQFTESEGGEL